MEAEVKEWCDLIRTVSFRIHRYLRHGHLEKIYENALTNRLRSLGVEVEQQVPIPVYDEDGTLLGSFAADLLVEKWQIIEVKACKNLCDEHSAQLLGYLCATNIEHGILVNFGAPKLQIKKLIFKPRDTEADLIA
ncbi:GxxExxY protein [bacterium]|nr:MAG: GxxExxY protein [bacterium]